MIILFGSYARNEWVEDRYDDDHFRYQSDMDILVIVQTKNDIAQRKYECDIECNIDKEDSIKTVASVIVHDIDFVNRRLRKAQYFFTDIKREGILLYDSGNHKLHEAKELLPQERRKLAQDDFDYYFSNADSLIKFVHFGLKEGELKESVFLLHQVTEKLYTAILLVFTHYKPNTHDLAILQKLTNSISNNLRDIFPFDTAKNIHLFKLLRKAYVDARYKPTYRITKEELEELTQRVAKLREIGHDICTKKIASFV